MLNLMVKKIKFWMVPSEQLTLALVCLSRANKTRASRQALILSICWVGVKDQLLEISKLSDSTCTHLQPRMPWWLGDLANNEEARPIPTQLMSAD
jgi:hypothetical protein